MTKSLVEKYKPEHPDGVAGNNKNLKKIKKWAKNWSEGDSAVLLHGEAGVGKTTSARAVANMMGWNIVEINASDRRSKEDIAKIVQEVRTKSLSEGRELFLIDECDSLSSAGDLSKILDDLTNPVIFTANEKWKIPDTIVNKCDVYKFKLGKNSIKPVLSDVAEKEDIDISNRQIGQLATRNGLRDALNDLQEYAVSEDDTDWDERQTEDSPFAVTERFLRNKNYLGDMTPPDKVEFLDENLSISFDGVELMRAYEALCEADKYNQIAFETNDYSNWAISGRIVDEVANMRLTEAYDGYLNINYPKSRRVLNKHTDSKEKQLFEELKGETGTGYSFSGSFIEFRNSILPVIEDLSDEKKEELAKSHSLSDSSMEFLGIDSDFQINKGEKDINIDNTEAPEEESEAGQNSIFDY